MRKGQKPRLALRERLLEAMRACPHGKRLEEYATDIKRCRTNVERVAALLFDRGLAVRMRAGVPMLWTAAEHAETLLIGVAAEKERQRERLEASGVKALRDAQRRKRRIADQQRYRAAKRAALPPQEQKPAPATPSRYRWPDESQWEPPRFIPSVWHLAQAVAEAAA